jgi:hypothetical protein
MAGLEEHTGKRALLLINKAASMRCGTKRTAAVVVFVAEWPCQHVLGMASTTWLHAC